MSIYFKLTSHIFAASFEDSIIILDSKSDNYISLINPAAEFLRHILENSFINEQNKYKCSLIDTEQLNYWIDFFIDQNFIQLSHIPNIKPIAPMPLKPGGLSNYQWDSKDAWQPFKRTSLLKTLPALWILIKIRWRMWRYGIDGILRTIPLLSQPIKTPSDQEIQQLANIVDAATYVYPKKTYCLAWAATFITLSRKRGWNSNLAIGVQAQPFYAHAWAEVNGKVVHDDPIITEVLSIIMKH